MTAEAVALLERAGGSIFCDDMIQAMRPLRIACSDFWPWFDSERWFSPLTDAFDISVVPEASIVVCGPFGSRHTRHRKTKVFWTGESWPYDRTDFDFAIGYQDGDTDRHLRLPLFVHTMLMADKCDHLRWERPTFDEWSDRPGFCNFIFSNPHCAPRNDFFRALSRRRPVTAPGAVFTNAPPIEDDLEHSRIAKIRYQQTFRFSIAFENASKPGYTTEKLLDALEAGTIPIYWGNPDVGADVDPRAFIDASDFSSLEELADYVIAMDDDRELARPYLEPREFLTVPLERWRDAEVEFFNRVLDFEQEQPPRSRQLRRAIRQSLRHTLDRGKRAIRRRARSAIGRHT